MNKVLYKNSEHTILYKDKKSKIMYKDKPYQDEELDYPSIVLCHFEDNFADGQITDAKGNILTKSGSNISISSDQAKFGSKSLKMTGSSYLYTATMDALWFSNGDFTIDCWVYTSNTYRQALFSFVNGGIYIDIQSRTPSEWFSNVGSGWLVNGDSGGDMGGKGTIDIPSNVWTHVAMVRHGSYLTLYVNGQVSKSVNIGSVNQRKLRDIYCTIGTWDPAQYYFSGYIDEIHITNKAMWTGAFTPPTKPYNN